MSKNGFFTDNTLTIGRTPLVRLNRLVDPSVAVVLAKVEGRNPAYSVKCRTGAAMVWDAERRGLLREGSELIEPTSGNTGIALAFVAAARGYRLTLIMPDSMSMERRRILKAFGANLVLTDGADGMQGAVKKAEEMQGEAPDRFVLLQQFRNPAGPRIHEQTTGPEIWADTDGQVDVLVAGVGTGGTISGVSRYFKHIRKKQILSVAVEPSRSPVIGQHLRGEELSPGPHQIQGIGAGFIPENLDLSIIDRVEQVDGQEAIRYAQRLASEEGLLSGISCGAAVAVASRLAAEPGMKGKTIVVVLPDSGERYLSAGLFDAD